MYVCHAEMNAIMNKNSASVEGCSIYVALFPCNECSKVRFLSRNVYFNDYLLNITKFTFLKTIFLVFNSHMWSSYNILYVIE